MMKGLLLSAMVAAAVSATAAPKIPEVVGHRGGSFYAPENTIPSYLLAWKLNADGIELDIHLSTDHKLMVMHDPTTSRTAQGHDLAIVKSSSEELKKLDVGAFKGPEFKGTRIPTLSEVLKIVPEGKQVFIEIKVSGKGDVLAAEKKVRKALVDKLKEVLDQFGHPERIVVISFDFPACELTHKLMPNLPVYWLISAHEHGKPRPVTDADVARIKKAGLTGIDAQTPAIDAAAVKKLRDAGLKVQTWTVENHEKLITEVTRMTKLKVDGITTNRPDVVRATAEKVAAAEK